MTTLRTVPPVPQRSSRKTGVSWRRWESNPRRSPAVASRLPVTQLPKGSHSTGRRLAAVLAATFAVYAGSLAGFAATAGAETPTTDPTARHATVLRASDGAANTIARAALTDAGRFWDRALVGDDGGCAGRIELYVSDLPGTGRYYPGACAVALDRDMLVEDAAWIARYRRGTASREDALISMREIWQTVTHEVGHERLGANVNPGAADPWHAPGHRSLMSTDAGGGRRGTIPGAGYAFAQRILPKPRSAWRAAKDRCHVETYGSGYRRKGLELICDGHHVRWIAKPRPPKHWPKPDPVPS